MEEEEHTGRKQQLALLCQKLNKFKKFLNEDDTDNINQVIGSNSPQSCLSYLTELEKKGDPKTDGGLLTRLIDFHTRVFSNLPLGKHCQNESYARMLVRFAQLKAMQDVNEAEANFNVARSYSPNFAFVHVAHAKFEQSRGNAKRGESILLKALEVGAEPKELLEAALQKLQTERIPPLCSEDKENLPYQPNTNLYDSVRKASEFQKSRRGSDGTGDLAPGNEALGGSVDEQLPGWRSAPQHKRAVGMPGRVPVVPFSIPEDDDDDDDEDGHRQKSSKRSGVSASASLSRQTSSSSVTSQLGLSSSKKRTMDGVARQQPVGGSPEHGSWAEQTAVDSTTSTSTLLHPQDSARVDDMTCGLERAMESSSAESCWAYLRALERRGDPRADAPLLHKLKDRYSQVLTRLPLRQFSKDPCYARILVRYAQLKGLDDPEEAQDHFIIARSNCKGHAFVHIAHAQFESWQGNAMKASSILHKAQALNARPAELLELALRNLKAGEKHLLPQEDEEEGLTDPQTVVPAPGNPELQGPVRVPLTRSAERVHPSHRDPVPEWKVPHVLSRHVSPQDKVVSPPQPKPIPAAPPESLQPPARLNPPSVCQTPNSYRALPPSSVVTPVVRAAPDLFPSAAASCPRTGPSQPPSTPQSSFPALSNETISINNKHFFVLKMIGRGGSSKVYQVLDHRKQLFAVKYVDLDEADAQTIQSYRNEIQHLQHLQQFSEQIIKLHDYEMTDSYIYMLMECGNLDLNTWLRNRKSVNPLERKFYWKNMLEAVHTIHKHGIVHSDLKPANFVIVNASLKLIDFGIANRIQPDVTSIMKDSQVGTLNYMPPEAIKDTSSQCGKARSKISPKGDVWSLGCILYCMTYGKTPFQSITNQIAKLHAILDPTHQIHFPELPERDLLDTLKRCLVRNPRERISVAELLEHPYLQLQESTPAAAPVCDSDLKKILTDLAALQSPNSILRAANNLARMCSSGRRLDVAECAKPPS